MNLPDFQVWLVHWFANAAPLIATFGLSALLVYLTSWGKVNADGTINPPRAGKVAAVISLSMWISVIVCGRLLTFYRPGPCPKEGPGWIADCTPRTKR